ncbi:MAG: glycoside hydrolase family 43 protein [Bacteroidales bacterium]
MKRLVKLLLAGTLLTGCGHAQEEQVFISTSFHEPATAGLRYIYSKDGIHWDSIPGIWLSPEVGGQKIMRDPSIVQGPDGTFHLVWTSSWKHDDGFGYASSKDLIHWTPQRHIRVMADEPATVNVWAPEIFYDEGKEQFMIVWASCIPGRFERGIEDEDNNQRLYYFTTRDFISFSTPKVLIDPGYSSIDATLVRRGPEDYVMVVKDNTRPMRNIKISFAKDAEGPWSEPTEPFTESFTEGPSVAIRDNDYIIYYDSYKKYIYGAKRTTDFIRFTDYTDSVSVPKGHKHGTIVKTSARFLKDLLKSAENK